MKNLLPVPESMCLRIGKALRAASLLLVAGTAAPCLAEVSVVADAPARHPRLLVLSEVRGGRTLYWTAVRQGTDPRLTLNAQGDRMGDGAPSMGMRPGKRQPWVVWPASDGHDKEIAYSYWADGRWQTPRFLERVDNDRDDLDPRIAFDAAGNPVVTWWRDDPVPRIFLSIQRNGQWSEPLAISDASLTNRSLSLRVQGNQAVLTFRTSSGQTVLYQNLSEIPSQSEGNGPLDGPVPPPGSELVPDPGQGADLPGVSCDGSCTEIILVRPTTND